MSEDMDKQYPQKMRYVKEVAPLAFPPQATVANISYQNHHNLDMFCFKPFTKSQEYRNHWGQRQKKIDSIIIHFTNGGFRSAAETFTNGGTVIKPKKDEEKESEKNKQKKNETTTDLKKAEEKKKEEEEERTGRTSAHYLITREERIEDKTTKKEVISVKAGIILRIVEDDKAAWHVGKEKVSGLIRDPKTGKDKWQRGGWNQNTLGIECVGTLKKCFDHEDQKKSLVHLVAGLVKSYGIDPLNIHGHADLDGDRKDPGVFCPWNTLGTLGLSAWLFEEERDVEKLTVRHKDQDDFQPFLKKDANRSERKDFFYTYLRKFGYDLQNLGQIKESIDNAEKWKIKGFYARYSCNQDEKRFLASKVDDPTHEDLLWAWGLVLKYDRM